MASRRPHSSKSGNEGNKDRTSKKEATSGPSNKRARLSGPKHRPKLKFFKPYLGFENVKLKPEPRNSLHVDMRFFHYGIQPGSIWEVKGPEKSGKTFLLTYFIARMLSVYPEKKVVLIDTRRKFSVKNLTSILYHIDQDLKNMPRTTNDFKETETSKKIQSYLGRVVVINCLSPEDLMLTLGPAGESTLEKLLLHDSKIGLVAVDAIDDFSNSEALHSNWVDHWPNIMHSLKQAVSGTRCPIICTTLFPASYREYASVHTTTASGFQRGDNETTSKQPLPEPAFGDLKDGNDKTNQNFILDYTTFTNILEIKPASEEAKRNITFLEERKITHYATAYLRSRQRAKTAGSGGNHCVKFSIFSDMLWVEK